MIILVFYNIIVELWKHITTMKWDRARNKSSKTFREVLTNLYYMVICAIIRMQNANV